jgi:reactive intermediate/imine deaminase
MKKEVVFSKDAAITGAPVCHATKLGNLVFCSGASPKNVRLGNWVVEGGFREQASQVLENLKAVLEAAGSGFEYVLKTTCFVMHFDENLPILNEVYVQYFGKNVPARTAFGVAKLRDNYLLEIEAIAYVP